jgi:hypothetical protein
MIITPFVGSTSSNTNVQICLRKNIPSSLNLFTFYKYSTCHNFVTFPCVEYNRNDSLFFKKGSLGTQKKLSIFKINFHTTGRATAASRHP